MSSDQGYADDYVDNNYGNETYYRDCCDEQNDQSRFRSYNDDSWTSERRNRRMRPETHGQSSRNGPNGCNNDKTCDLFSRCRLDDDGSQTESNTGEHSSYSEYRGYSSANTSYCPMSTSSGKDPSCMSSGSGDTTTESQVHETDRDNRLNTDSQGEKRRVGWNKWPYETVGRGSDTQGGKWAVRDYQPHGNNPLSMYRTHRNGTYEYHNPDDSRYIRYPDGRSTFKSADGRVYEKHNNPK